MIEQNWHPNDSEAHSYTPINKGVIGILGNCDKGPEDSPHGNCKRIKKPEFVGRLVLVSEVNKESQR